ncbi:hypothetical protein GW17_00027400 [Ensete ventricosum]|nr:hypothetical protein GW17_00027400 [Ensete ventricosum]RZS07285.1 hypothetical protein BHM03_00038102 [Ensete ventricosum]
MTGAMKLQSDDEPRSSLSIRLGFRRCSGISLEFARRFVEGIGKLVGNTLGDHREKTGRLVAMSDRCTVAAQVFGRLTHLGCAFEPPVPKNLGTLSG